VHLVRWLNTPRSVLWLFVTGTLCLFFCLFISLGCSVVYYAMFGVSLMPDWQGLNQMTDEEQIGYFAFGLCCTPLNAVLEELIFRAPLSIIGKIWPGSAMPLLAAIPLSIFFGWLHGGWATVPYQGACGMVFCLYYLKAGGQEGKFRRPLVVSSLVHAAYDTVVLGFVLTVSLMAH
jgi:membrane protease YdiL (CAAX protease family)